MTLATIALGQRMQTEDSQAILQRRLYSRREKLNTTQSNKLSGKNKETGDDSTSLVGKTHSLFGTNRN